MQIVHHQSQRLALANVFHSTRVQEQTESRVVTSSLRDHTAACYEELATFTATVSPFLRPQLEKALQACIDETLAPTANRRDREEDRTPSYEPQNKTMVKTVRKKVDYVPLASTFRQTIFGTFRFFVHLGVSCAVDTTGEILPAFDDQTATSRMTFVPSQWLRRMGFTQAMDLRFASLGYTGWKINIRMPQLRPDSSQVFEYCKTGDIDGIRSLFFRGLASVIDVDSRGCTPLHIAAQHHHPALCQLLIDQKADINVRDWGSWNQSPLSRACRVARHTIDYADDPNSEPRQIQTFRKFLAAGFDLESEDHVLRIASFSNADAVARPGRSTTKFEFPSQWLLKQMLSSILENPRVYDTHFWRGVLIEALKPPGDNPIAAVLPYCDSRAVRSALLGFCRVL